MKIKIGVVSFLMLSSLLAKAEGPLNCELSTVKMTLDTAASSSCQALKLEGIYQIKLCSNDQGRLTSQNGFERYLFKGNNDWFARQDTYDFDQNVSVSEVFQIDSQLSMFRVDRTKAKRDRTVLEKFECTGKLEKLAQP